MTRSDKVSALLTRLRASDIHVQLAGEELKITGNRQLMTSDLLEELKEVKADIVYFLKGYVRRSYDGIPLLEDQEHYEVSCAQRRLWIVHQQQESRRAYNVFEVSWLRHKVELPVLKMAVRLLITRHETLRTTFCFLRGAIRQRIHDPQSVKDPVLHTDISDNKEKAVVMDAVLQEEMNYIFDLEHGPLFRIRLIKLDTEEYAFCFNVHHIITDAWSMEILLRELNYFYSERLSGSVPALLPLSIQYRHYTVWQKRLFGQEEGQRLIAYWREQLGGELPVLALVTDFPRPAVKRYEGRRARAHLDDNIRRKMLQIGRQAETGIFMVLVAAVGSLLFRYTGQSDIMLGTPVSGREHAELEQQVGCYINMVVLRCRFSGDQSFRDLLRIIEQIVLDAYMHQQYPFDQLVEELDAGGDRSRNPLFDVMITYKKLEDTIGKESRWESNDIMSKFDLTFQFQEGSDGISLELYYNTTLFLEERINGMLTHFRGLLDAVTACPDQPLDELDYLSMEEKGRLLCTFNNTTMPYPGRFTLKHLLEDQSIKTPDNIAVCYERDQLSYKDLHKAANRLAWALKNKGVGVETLVPVCLERSMDMIIAILAVLKAGGAYVPIDPSYPYDRIHHILRDTNAKLVLCNNASHSKLGQIAGITYYSLDDEQVYIRSMPDLNIDSNPAPGNMAYIIYTSGSTGKPKGVIIEHNAIVNRLYWTQAYFQLQENDRVLQKTTFCFDVSVWELLWPLCTGAALVIAEPEGHRNNMYLRKIISEQRITTIHFVPSMLDMFLADVKEGDCKPLKRVLCSGESLEVHHIKKFRKKLGNVDLYNLYGPTEAAIDVSCWHLSRQSSDMSVVPIGKPVSNTKLYVLDRNRQLLAQGMEGKLYIGGQQLARGYLNNQEQTAERFITHAYGRLYDTGDKARWLWDGDLAFLGRDDEQVKIRGNRVEPGEVTGVIMKYGGVEGAAVTVHMEEGEPLLVAYVTWSQEDDETGLRNYLHTQLPAYMHPAVYVSLSSFPLTASGKIDKKRLPAPDRSAIKIEYIAAGDKIEEKMVSIWEELFHKKRIGVRDDFFELGGHSLKAIRLVSRIFFELGIQTDINTIFLFPTIRALCTELKNSISQEAELYKMANAVSRTFNGKEHFYEVTSRQRYWLDENKDREYKQRKKQHGLITMAAEISGYLDTALFERAVKFLIDRHETLRATFHLVEEKYWMKINNEERWDRFYESRLVDTADTPWEGFIFFQEHQFDFEHGPLFKVRLLKINSDKHIVSIGVHHIISDAWSNEIIVRDLLMAYQAYRQEKSPSLPLLKFHFKEYLAYIINHRAQYWQIHREYWRTMYPDMPHPLIIPAERKAFSSALHGRITQSCHFTFPDHIYARLKEWAREFATGLFVILQAGFKSYLYSRTGQRDIIIGTYMHGRDYPGAENQVGGYARTVLIRTAFDKGLCFNELVQKVRKANRDVLEYNAFPLLEWLQEILPPGQNNGKAFWKINLQYNDSGEYYVNKPVFNEIMDGFDVRVLNPSKEEQLIPVDIQLSFVGGARQLELLVEYDSSSYTPDAVKGMIGDFFVHLEYLAKERFDM